MRKKKLFVLFFSCEKQKLYSSSSSHFILLKIAFEASLTEIHLKQITYWFSLQFLKDCISGLVVSMLAFSAVDRGFESRSGQTKDGKIGICCFSPKPTALRRKSKDWLARNQDNVSEWNDISLILWLFFVFFTGERKICSITCDFFVLGFWLDLRKVMTQTDY